jgi:hypothetical protein
MAIAGRGGTLARLILIDEIHVTICVPNTLPPPQDDAIRKALEEPGFRRALGRAVRAVIRRRPALARVRVTVTR